MDRDEFYDRIRAFIREPRPGRDAVTDVPVDEDDNLFDLGLVNSFSMVRLLVHIEELLGVQVDVTQHEPESFFTLRGMYDSLALASSPS